MKGCTVHIVDDDPGVAEALQLRLQLEGYVVATYASGRDFLDRMPTGCGCIVLDLRLGDMSGHEVLAELERRGNALPVLILTAYGDIPATVRAIRGGAQDFMTKSDEPSQLLKRIGELVGQSRQANEGAAGEIDVRQAWARLSAREQEILDLAARGIDSRTMAERLGVSLRTIEAHRSHVARKFGVVSLAEVFRLAARQGINLAGRST